MRTLPPSPRRAVLGPMALALALVAWVGSPAVTVGASAQGVGVSAQTSAGAATSLASVGSFASAASFGSAASFEPAGPATPATPVAPSAPSARSAPLRTIDGCHGGRIVAPLVPIWSAHPEREPARRIGWLRGTHRRDLCRGTVVIVHERERIRGRAWVHVEPIDGPGPGWIDESFLGSFFPRWKCDWRFEGDALERCLRA